MNKNEMEVLSQYNAKLSAVVDGVDITGITIKKGDEKIIIRYDEMKRSTLTGFIETSKKTKTLSFADNDRDSVVDFSRLAKYCLGTFIPEPTQIEPEIPLTTFQKVIKFIKGFSVEWM